MVYPGLRKFLTLVNFYFSCRAESRPIEQKMQAVQRWHIVYKIQAVQRWHIVYGKKVNRNIGGDCIYQTKRMREKYYNGLK